VDLVAIYLNSFGLYGISIRENVLTPSSQATAPASFLRASLPALSVQIANNFRRHDQLTASFPVR
jgi:hypothetical protein